MSLYSFKKPTESVADDALLFLGHVPFALVTRGSSPEAQKADLVEMLKAINQHVRSGTSPPIFSLRGGLELIFSRFRENRSRKHRHLRRISVRKITQNSIWVGPFSHSCLKRHDS